VLRKKRAKAPQLSREEEKIYERLIAQGWLDGWISQTVIADVRKQLTVTKQV